MSTAAQRNNGRGRSRVPAVEAEHVPTMAEAMLAVQTEAPKLTRNADGQVGPRTYKYVTLDNLLDAVLPLLVKHELVWAAFPTTTKDGEPALRYRLTHITTGDWIEDTMPLMCSKPDPQGQGSAITYARRYALTAVLNLAPDDDDDGAAASGASTNTSTDVSTTPTAAAPKPSERPANAAQRNMLRKKAEVAKLSPEGFANLLLEAGEGSPHDWSDEAAAQRWIDRNLDRFPARCVTAAKEKLEALAS